MNARNGKIARLPKNIREELNRRLENGEPSKTIIEWLNQLPEVQKLVAEQFGGHPIRPQNLSQWRHGGYRDWTRHQLLREQTRWTAEQATDLDSDTDSKSISIAEDIAMIMSAELAIHVQALTAMTNQKNRFRQFQLLSRELSRLRHDDQRAISTHLRRLQWRAKHPPIKKESDTDISPTVGRDSVEPKLSASEPTSAHPTPEPLTSPSAGGSSPSARTVLASRAQNEPYVSKPNEAVANSESVTPERQRAGALSRQGGTPRNSVASAERASVPDCGSPLPLSEAVEKPNPDTTPEQPPYNLPLPALSTINTPSAGALAKEDQPSSNPIPPNPTKSHHKIFSVPIHGRGFTCIEG